MERYKRLTRSLPVWDIGRVALKIGTAQNKRAVATPPRPKPLANKPLTGIEGYSGMKIEKKRYWFNEE